jgi:hypothetical protein
VVEPANRSRGASATCHRQQAGHKPNRQDVGPIGFGARVSKSMPSNGEQHMTDIRERRTDDEPIGIVISRGTRAESTPRFAAYVWSQAGDMTPAVTEPRAA